MIDQTLISLEAQAHELIGEGRYAEAIKPLRTLLSLRRDFEHGHALIALAQCLEEIGSNGEAEALFREALAMDPGYNFFQFELGRFLADLGLAEGTTILEHVADGSIDDPVAQTAREVLDRN